jgi:hypothetical protein
MKLIITSDSSDKYPIFETNSSVVIFKSSFIHVGSYVTTIIAHDPTTGFLIEDYSIVSELVTPNSGKTYFRINAYSGSYLIHLYPG